jgi:hypothetical protein
VTERTHSIQSEENLRSVDLDYLPSEQEQDGCASGQMELPGVEPMTVSGGITTALPAARRRSSLECQQLSVRLEGEKRMFPVAVAVAALRVDSAHGLEKVEIHFERHRLKICRHFCAPVRAFSPAEAHPRLPRRQSTESPEHKHRTPSSRRAKVPGTSLSPRALSRPQFWGSLLIPANLLPGRMLLNHFRAADESTQTGSLPVIRHENA